MHDNHVSDQKKTECFETLSAAQLSKVLTKVKSRCIDDAGGVGKWLKLDRDELAAHYKAGMDKLALRLGKKQHKKLSEAEKQEINIFFWAGCSMHKELNYVVGGYAVCAKFWEDSRLDLPVLLANKDNNATITLAALSGLTLEAADQAVKALEWGAVKLTQLTGSLFHHKDDKKGYQDQHHDYSMFDGQEWLDI
ncbi:uncharacterized protein ARMOST_16200 [Armillaria ostoyae]|uniref:Uncharacterized protein n=1 Tax=Armillaria ostoyae TaxID=47428 RepID=A0A284RVI9_ARMOS|nr:uncharacterized protein ARMOST_16200 [Armillaria ostoyae]